jgi:DNA/RNA endonuclease G (NUC1)
MAQSFYYSNIAPQLPILNRGSWKKLEAYARKLAKAYDSVLVWGSSVALADKYIGSVAVPDYCWKVLYIKKLNRIEPYSFRNDGSRLGYLILTKYLSIQHLSKLTFSKK